MNTYNYHTHTYRCKHASGDIDEYITEAKRIGLKKLGFSEHIPLPRDRWSHSHMDDEGFPEYIDTVREAQEREAGVLEIALGGEVEYLKEYHGYFHDELLASGKLDYLLGAPHWIRYDDQWLWPAELHDVKGLIAYGDYCQDLFESELFGYIAHPDIIFSGYRKWDANAISLARDIIQCSITHNLPLEINANGLRKSSIESFDGIEDAHYPNYRFWELAADYPVKAVIGSDCHAVELLGDRLDICRELADSLEIKVIDPKLR